MIGFHVDSCRLMTRNDTTCSVQRCENPSPNPIDIYGFRIVLHESFNNSAKGFDEFLIICGA